MSRTLAALLLLCCAIGTTTGVVPVDTSVVSEMLNQHYRLFAQELGNLGHFTTSLGASLSNVGSALKHFEAKSKFATQGTPLDLDCQAKLGALAALFSSSCGGVFSGSLANVTMNPDALNVPAFCSLNCTAQLKVAVSDVQTTCVLSNYSAQVMASNITQLINFIQNVNLRQLDFVTKGVCANDTNGYCYPQFFSTAAMIANSMKNPSAASAGGLPPPAVFAGICTPCWFKVLSFYAEFAFRQQDGKLAFFFSAANAVCMKENGTYCLFEIANPANLPTGNTTSDIPNLREICRTRCFLRIASLQANSIRLQLSDPTITIANYTILSTNLTLIEAGKAAYRFVCSRNMSDSCFHIYSALQNNFMGAISTPIGTKFITDCTSAITGAPCSTDCLNDLTTYFGKPAGCCLGAAVRFLNNSAIQAQITDTVQKQMVTVLLSCTKAGLDVTPCAGPHLDIHLGLDNLKFGFVSNNLNMVTRDIQNDLSVHLGSEPVATAVSLSGYTPRNQVYTGTVATCSIATDSPQTAMQMKEILDYSTSFGSIQLPSVASYDASMAANSDSETSVSLDASSTNTTCSGPCVPGPETFPYSGASSSTGSGASSSSTSTNDAPASPLRSSSSSLLSILAISALAFIFA